jgi:hypothetical protein
MRLIILIALAAVGAAQELGLPRVGCLVDDAGSLRPVFGLAGNFLIGGPERANVLSAACSGSLTAIQTDSGLEVNGRSWEGPQGRAVFALAGRDVVAWLPDTAELVAPGGRRVAYDLQGEVLALSATSHRHATAVVRRGDSLWLCELRGGFLYSETELSGIRPPVFLAGGALMYTDGADLVIDNVRLALPEPVLRFEQLGAGAIRIVLAAGHLVLWLRDGEWQLYRLPEIVP